MKFVVQKCYVTRRLSLFPYKRRLERKHAAGVREVPGMLIYHFYLWRVQNRKMYLVENNVQRTNLLDWSGFWLIIYLAIATNDHSVGTCQKCSRLCERFGASAPEKADRPWCWSFHCALTRWLWSGYWAGRMVNSSMRHTDLTVLERYP